MLEQKALGDGPYTNEGRHAAGSSWPYGHPGHLPAKDYPAGHEGGAADMLDRLLTEEQEDRAREAHRVLGTLLRQRNCSVQDCTQPDTGGCEVHTEVAR